MREDAVLFAVPQLPEKLHPDMDEAWLRILVTDPAATIVFLAPTVKAQEEEEQELSGEAVTTSAGPIAKELLRTDPLGNPHPISFALRDALVDRLGRASKTLADATLMRGGALKKGAKREAPAFGRAGVESGGLEEEEDDEDEEDKDDEDEDKDEEDKDEEDEDEEEDSYASRLRSSSERMLFVGKLHPRYYYALLREARCVLDTSPFGGYTTTMDALSVGTPAVTMRHAVLARGRATAAVIAAMARVDRNRNRRRRRRRSKAEVEVEVEVEVDEDGGPDIGEFDGDASAGEEEELDLEEELVATDIGGYVRRVAALSFEPFRETVSGKIQAALYQLFGEQHAGRGKKSQTSGQWGDLLVAAATRSSAIDSYMYVNKTHARNCRQKDFGPTSRGSVNNSQKKS